MTIGDVFGIVSALLGLFLTLWAMTITSNLLFPTHVGRAREAVDRATGKTLLLGFVLLAVPGVLGVALLSAPDPGGKLLGWILLLVLLFMASIGLAGIARIAAVRIQELDGTLGDYPAYLRGAAFLIGGSMLPILGWFAFGPALLAASLGAGCRAIIHRRENNQVAEAA